MRHGELPTPIARIEAFMAEAERRLEISPGNDHIMEYNGPSQRLYATDIAHIMKRLKLADNLAACVSSLDDPGNEEEANEIYGAMLTALARYREAKERTGDER